MSKKILSVTLFITVLFSSHLFASKDIKTLSEKQQNMITISAFTATGDLYRLEWDTGSTKLSS